MTFASMDTADMQRISFLLGDLLLDPYFCSFRTKLINIPCPKQFAANMSVLNTRIGTETDKDKFRVAAIVIAFAVDVFACISSPICWALGLPQRGDYTMVILGFWCVRIKITRNIKCYTKHLQAYKNRRPLPIKLDTKVNCHYGKFEGNI